DALKSAMEKNDRPVQAKCLHSFAEIHKKLHDFEKAYPRYEAALNIMVETGDRYGQMEVLIGRADAMMLGNNVKKVPVKTDRIVDHRTCPTRSLSIYIPQPS
ncbi:43 kDa receptor-associated protein of the synapse-like, partial [Lingula anatina]|uniref:43 kDa receptor-associated protein of the synapse-like n=1 Tax=Lingula anatina TaxID=7574 RepID=A0A2R2MNU4_LINAN